jgi:hypothetical protein
MPGRHVLHPERFHGHRKRPPFFEGWYYKLVDAGERHRLAVIPGIYLSDDPGRHHAFVQILDGSTGEADYHRYPAEAFVASEDRFDVRIGPNRFTADGFELDIGHPSRAITGSIRIDDPLPWPVSLAAPGVMGWYGWVPWMECNHAVVSMDHRLSGTVELGGRSMTFDEGRGYMEKDWGKSFPRGYVWMQTNHFDAPRTSLVASIAIVPWLFSAFPGFFVGFLHEGVLHRFASYTGAETVRLRLTDERVEWDLADDALRLTLAAERTSGGLLLGPTREDMGDRVGETLVSSVEVTLETVGGTRVFGGIGHNAGLEVQGDIDRLLGLQR